MAEEYQICEVPKEDIKNYARMTYSLNRGSDEQAGEMKRFLSIYGKDVREIQSNMGKHLEACFLCSSYYRECLEDEVEAERFVKTMGLMGGVDMGSIEKGLKKKKEWRIEHSAYENPENLRQYLFMKAASFVKNKPFGLSLEFERHIEGCGSCQEVYNLELEIIREIRKNLEG